MQLECPQLDVLVPDGISEEAAARRTTHLGIGAHPDDLEIMAIHGILQCRGSDRDWFTGIVACDGAGSPRSGRYAGFSDAQMAETRRDEQRQAAQLGGYGLQLQLGYSSAAISEALVENLATILGNCSASVVYIHNLADAHATHRAMAAASLAALRRLPPERQPSQLYGVEVWRSLDWLPEPYRVSLPLQDDENLQAALLRCHDSQVSGGKRYDEAILARQRANATLTESHDIDRSEATVLAMDLLPLLRDPELDARDWLDRCADAFREALDS